MTIKIEVDGKGIEVDSWEQLFDTKGAIVLDTYHIYDELHTKSPLSTYYINFRSTYEDTYPAKFDPEFARFIIQLYSKPGWRILDPMAGSGTIPIIAYDLGRFGAYQDINQAAFDLYYEKMKLEKGHTYTNVDLGDSSKKIKHDDNSIDLIITSPPFGLSIDQKHDKYSDHPDDIANSKDYDLWRGKMQMILKEMFRVLKPGHLAFIETRPRSKKGHSYPLNAWVTLDGMEVGFNYYCDFVEIVDTYRMWTFGVEWKRKPMPAHSNVVVLEKPEQEKLV